MNEICEISDLKNNYEVHKKHAHALSRSILSTYIGWWM